MQNLPLHPAIVHVPLGLAVVIPLIALGTAIAFWRGLLPKRAWGVVVALQLVMMGAGGLALRTGEGDEDRVERVVPERVIEGHEQRAQIFMAGGGLALAAAILVLFLKRESAARWAATGATALTFLVAGLAVRTGQAGGDIVYGHAVSPASVGAAAPTGGGDADGDAD
jgi:uncharacterized membrane protein